MREQYSEEEANAILRKAVERQPVGGMMAREQLESIAAELGISPTALAEAEDAWAAEREESDLRASFDAERRAAFWEHMPHFIAGNVLLFAFLFVALKLGNTPVGLALLIAMLVSFLKKGLRGLGAYWRGPAREEEFRTWRARRLASPAPLRRRRHA